MRKLKVYLDTSVVSYLYQPDILLGYLKQVQYHLVYTDEDTVELAEKFINFECGEQRP